MIKRISTIFVVLALCLSLCACGGPGHTNIYLDDTIFENVAMYADGHIYRHRETNVFYAYSGSGMTVLFNADGTPMVWDGR